ncbi:MAG TPA: hypothetical protein VF642_12490 [Propionibacteriaceae bacterium]|jgi:hypothetical protein
MTNPPGAFRTTAAALEFVQLPQATAGLPAPFRIAGDTYEADILFKTDTDLQQWVDWIRLDDEIADPARRPDSNQVAATFVHDAVTITLVGFVRDAVTA